MRTTALLMLNFYFTLIFLVLLGGCDFGEQGSPDPDPARQTEIGRVEVVPNPVVANDTALFRVTIKDSLSERFDYRWTRALGDFVGGEPQFRGMTTDTNSIRWVAPSRIGTFGFTVRTDNGSRDSTAVGQSFDVTVVEKV
ncbi:MAG: hypothetical protein ACR2GR_11480 [Rhodothermales bacterium]